MDISNIISRIWKLYVDITQDWNKRYSGERFNKKQNTIKKVHTNIKMYEEIVNYRNFLIKNSVKISELNSLINTDSLSNFECRIKNLNSVDSKKDNYINSKEHEYGEIPINKCFNDLLGFRYIYSNTEVITKKSIEEAIDKLALSKFIKVIDSSKPKFGYKALHIYLKLDNLSFPWEIQVWNKDDEPGNRISHKKYKQGYTTYEDDYKTDEEKLKD